ncbi:MAG: ABC transporter substrate-binding protein [Rhodospirillaceae bacterium]|nr:amino acid ABC transporter substrate-binding protein [Rhodospirillaceae bacterium]MDE0619741.1 amino acid ABC transporter substrate-binding protein [Rhodospirillaceae bacterium]MXY41204.1 ABC transporter substrate-binding protein [Rhodospirillaceae bacterium]MYH37365.1 ABC transporter substrate-binding protein [Rhodospirillaceae bacterium]MYK13120.1 ABC transporter substrate-binding protein [Rhodospirillaceae bacterium]
MLKHCSPATVIAAAAVAAVIAAPASAKVEGDTIVLGSALSETGKYSTNGIHAKNGYNIAIDLINKTGGVKVGGKSYKLRVIYYDDESTPARGAQLAERLIRQDGVKYMLGPYSSGLTKAIAPVTEKYRIPMVEAEGASRSLFTKGYKYLFAVLSTSEQYLASAIQLAAEIADKAGKKRKDVKIAMAFENDPFSLDVRAGVMDDIKRLGMTVVIDDRLPRDLSDMTATLTKVRALKPDLLVVSGHSKGAATAGRQIKELKIATPMVAMTHCESSKLVSKFGAAVNGFLCPTQWAETLSYTGKYFGSAADFDKKFKATFSGYKTVPYQSAQAAAAVLVWKEAFERANSFDKEKVREAIASTEMMTFYGGIKFSKAGNNIAKPMVLRQIQDGKYVVVAPSKWASHKVQHPRPVQ